MQNLNALPTAPAVVIGSQLQANAYVASLPTLSSPKSYPAPTHVFTPAQLVGAFGLLVQPTTILLSGLAPCTARINSQMWLVHSALTLAIGKLGITQCTQLALVIQHAWYIQQGKPHNSNGSGSAWLGTAKGVGAQFVPPTAPTAPTKPKNNNKGSK